MTPRLEIKLNLAQWLDLLAHSKLSLMNLSSVVPAYIKLLAKITAEWATDYF